MILIPGPNGRATEPEEDKYHVPVPGQPTRPEVCIRSIRVSSLFTKSKTQAQAPFTAAAAMAMRYYNSQSLSIAGAAAGADS